LDGAMQLAEHMRVVIEALLVDDGIRITASFGVAVYNFDEDADSVMRRVDAAMYAAKQQGRNRVAIATE
jgi:diguanylate cyclase